MNRTEGREFRRQSLLDEFSISEFRNGTRPETGCVSAETGSIRETRKPRSGAGSSAWPRPKAYGTRFRVSGRRHPAAAAEGIQHQATTT
jgi:hypothetical protein